MKRILSISLIIIILTANTGLSIATHYCGGQAVMSELMLGNGNLDCGMSNTEQSCETNSAGKNVGRESCCDNKILGISSNIEDNYNVTVKHPAPNAKFVFAFVYTFFQLYAPEVDKRIPSLNCHPPPFSEQDFQVLYQTFLI